MTGTEAEYESPKLVRYGDLEEITKGRGSLGSDVGTNGTNQGRAQSGPNS